MLAKFAVQSGLRGIVASAFTVIITLSSVAVWAWSHGDFSRATAWDYYAGTASILVTAAGAFHLIENTPALNRGNS